jgi:hypothetical protein
MPWILTMRTLRRLAIAFGAATALAGSPTAFAWDDPPSPTQNNFAIAENHRDYSTLIRTSMKVVFVRGDVTAINAADAEASCTHCQTTAVAIEAIIVEGYPSVYTPQNYAIALNFKCHYCDTAAYAGQFDLQYAGPVRMTDRGQNQFDALAERLQRLERSGLSSVAIVQQAATIRRDLETVLRNNLVPVDGGENDPTEHDRASIQAA